MESSGAAAVRFSLDDVRRAIDAASFSKGRIYLAEGRVDELEISGGGSTIRAAVTGGRARPYRVTAYATRRRERVALSGICSCPIGADCKHVAAVFLAALEGRSQSEAPAFRDGARDDVDLWLYRIESIAGRVPAAATASERVAYVFPDLDPQTSVLRAISVVPVVVGGATNGSASNPRETTFALVAAGKVVSAEAEDLAIARVASALGSAAAAAATELGDEVLRRIVDTGRAYLETVGSAALRRGSPRGGALSWILDPSGAQRLRIEIASASLLTMRPAPWYVDRDTDEAGEIDARIPRATLGAILGSPAISPADVDRVAPVFERLGLPAPVAIEERAREIVPVPTLILRNLERRAMTFDTIALAADDDRSTSSAADLAFDYDGTLVDPTSRAADIRRLGDDGVSVVRRAFDLEARAAERLRDFGLQPLVRHGRDAVHARFALPPATDPRTLVFLHRYVPKLRAEGWRIESDAGFERRVVDLATDEAWRTEATPRADGWFELALDVIVEGRRIALLPFLAAFALAATDDERAILRELPSDEPYYVELRDGIAAAIPAGRLRAILATLTELEDPAALASERLALPRERLPALSDLEREGRIAVSSGALAAIARRLAEPAASQAVEAPRALRGSLRTYQLEGFARLQLWRELGFGGILADDMGLGKSVQTLAHLLHERDAGRLAACALVVVPTSLVQNWCDEAARFAPSLRVLALHGPARAQRVAEIDAHDVVVTTYALLVRDEIFTARTWSIAVLDEAQAIKNANSRVARTARRLRADQRLALTGTPIENDLGELWSLVDVVAPGLLGDRKRFATLFRTPIEKRDDVARRRALAARIAPFVVRRTKERVAPELPQKTEILRRVELEGTQRDLYESVRLAMRTRVADEIARSGVARSGIVVLDGLLKLRQVCCDPRLLPEPLRRDAPSAKLALLMEMLPQLVAAGRRVLVFSQFTTMLALIAADLDAAGLAYATLTGETRDRPEAVRRFQEREVPIFLISLRAGGVGLNLTAADTVVHFDPWWNPAVERQATDRAHRIGQTEPVFVYKLACADTVEEKIVELGERKGALADAMLSDESDAGTAFVLDERTIDDFFGVAE